MTVAVVIFHKAKSPYSTSLGTEDDDDSLLEPESSERSKADRLAGVKGDDWKKVGASIPPNLPRKIPLAAEVRDDGEV